MTIAGPPVTEDATYSLDPIDVRVVEDATLTKQEAADFGGWATFIASNTSQQILRHNPRRHRAIILVFTLTTGSTPPDGVIIGTASQLASQRNLTPALTVGGFLPIGTTIVLENVQELYMQLNSASVNGVGVSVLDELFGEGSHETQQDSY